MKRLHKLGILAIVTRSIAAFVTGWPKHLSLVFIAVVEGVGTVSVASFLIWCYRRYTVLISHTNDHNLSKACVIVANMSQPTSLLLYSCHLKRTLAQIDNK